jgi:uncharacterized membrane protein
MTVNIFVQVLSNPIFAYSCTTILYGAVTTGDIWQFASFERSTRTVTQDLMLYRVLTDLELLLPILNGILTQEYQPVGRKNIVWVRISDRKTNYL